MIAALKPKILVVENQTETLISLMLLLERVGFYVFGAQTGSDGIRLAQKEEFDLVILDINLPDRDGFEVCAWFRQDFRFARTPIFLVSGRWNEEHRRHALELGAADCIDKPFDGTAITELVSRHVKAPKR